MYVLGNNRKVIVTVISALLLLNGCFSGAPDDTLVQAEELMNTHPDSALAILKNIPSPHLNTGKRQALFALLYSQALDKNFIDVKEDSLINLAVVYYDAHHDPYHQMLAHYYHSRVQYNAGNYAASIVSAQKAEKYAKTTEDNFFLGLIYREIAAIYSLIYNAREEVRYSHLSHQSFLKASAGICTDFALLDVGDAYYNNHEYQESIRIARQSFDTGYTKRDTLLMAESLHLLGNSLLALHKYKAAKDTILCLQALSPNCLSDPDYKNLALAYFKEDNLDSTLFYQHKIDKNNSATSWIDYEIYSRKGNYLQALQALEIIKKAQDSMIHQVLSQNISSALSQYYKEEEELSDYKLQHEKEQRTGIIIMGILLIFSLLTVYYTHLKGKQRKIDYTMLAAQQLNDRLNQMDSEMKERNGLIDELLRQKFDILDRLCHTYYECKDTQRERERIHQEVIRLLSKFKKDPYTQTELETFLNTYKHNLMTTFRKEFPKLKNSDYQLFLYYALGFSPVSISIFLQEKPEVIYNRKNRLKNKIKNSGSNKKELFMQIF